MIVHSEHTLKIQHLNDEFRRAITGGLLIFTPGIEELPIEEKLRLISAIRNFSAFDNENDPYGEHDFGTLDENGKRAYFKIDYYDPKLQGRSHDPSNALITTRVMTVMLAHEY